MLTHADVYVSPPVRLQLLRCQYAYFVLVKQVKLAGVLLLPPSPASAPAAVPTAALSAP